MAKAKKDTKSTPQDTPNMAKAMMSMNPMANQAWLDVMQESADFVTRRLEQDLETQKAMMAAKSPTELMQLQTEFFQTAFQQYSQEAMRMFESMTKAAGQSTKTATKHTSRGYDDVPL